MAQGPALDFIKTMKLKDIAASMDDTQKEIIETLLDIANGREVDFDPSEIQRKPPRSTFREK